MAEHPDAHEGNDPNEPHSFFQNFQHTPVGARVPEKVGRGVFATAAMILQTNDLFVIDFLSMVVPPQQVVSRVVMTVPNFMQFLGALRTNAKNYESQFGPLATRPSRPAQDRPGTTTETPPAAPSPAPRSAKQRAASASSESEHGEGPKSRKPSPEMSMPAPTAHPTSSDVGSGGAGGQAAITDFYDQVKFPEDLLGGAFANAVMVRHTPEEFCFDFICNLFPRPVVAARIFMAATRIPAFIDAVSSSLQRFRHTGGNPPPTAPGPAPEA